ncbi:RNA binding motif protein 26 [Phyllostomus discolor]|uniref:RNA binding motif protein 26 n=1 Tax=Phyllostomus discolor TaxID=89673 RepID=A0A833Z1D8_9CHIR|nr:RNA binding motif protein 26 [Phyllostomus discolor]
MKRNFRKSLWWMTHYFKMMMKRKRTMNLVLGEDDLTDH